jgi:hypothetical protein
VDCAGPDNGGDCLAEQIAFWINQEPGWEADLIPWGGVVIVGPQQFALCIQVFDDGIIDWGTDYLVLSQLTQHPSVTVMSGGDGYNSGAIISAYNAAAHTFDSGTFLLTITDAQALVARTQESGPFTLTSGGQPAALPDVLDELTIAGFDLDIGDQVVLSGNDVSGASIAPVTLTINLVNSTSSEEVKSMAGLMSAMGQYFDPTDTTIFPGTAIGGGQRRGRRSTLAGSWSSLTVLRARPPRL